MDLKLARSCKLIFFVTHLRIVSLFFFLVPAMSTDMVDVHTVMEHKLGLRV